MERKMNLFVFCLVILFIPGCATKSVVEGPEYTILGGPSSGTFNLFAKEISKIVRDETGINIVFKSSKSSLENIKKVNSHQNAFAVAYASHIFKRGMVF